MKNFTTLFLGVSAAALVLTGCRQNPDAPEFTSIDKTETFREGSGNFELDYRFEYLSWYTDENVAEKICADMTAAFFGEEYLRENPMDSSVAFDRATAGMYTSTDTVGHKWSGFLKIRSHHDVIGGRLVAYTVERGEYMGGAHGMESVMYYNYDLRNGNLLTLDDVFTPEGKADLAGKIRVRILEDYEKANWAELNEEGCFFAEDSVQPTENFRLSKEHIIFMYNPYDIACFAQGGTKVTLPLKELAGFKSDILKK